MIRTVLIFPPPLIKHKEIVEGITRHTINKKLRHETYFEMHRERPIQRCLNREIQ